MNRSESRTQMRRRAMRAFNSRNRLALSLEAVREPEPGETALSRSEIAYGVRVGLIAAHPAPARGSETLETSSFGASA